MEAPISHLNVIIVNPHFTDPHISELEALTAKVIELNPDVVYLKTNKTCSKWIVEQLKAARIDLHASASCEDDFKCVLINNTRQAHEYTSSYDGRNFEAYKIVLKDKLTHKINAVGLAVIHEYCMTINQEANGDRILKKHDLEKWFDLDKEIEHVVQAKVGSVPFFNTNQVLYSNLKKLLPAEEHPKKESKPQHHGVSALIHLVFDKKKPVKEVLPEQVVATMNVNTIFCKIRMQHHAASVHVIDNGERFHQMKLADKPDLTKIPSMEHTTH